MLTITARPAVVGPATGHHGSSHEPVGFSSIGLVVLMIWLTGPGQLVADTTQRPTNIILIMADDIGYECFGGYGSEQYHTPNLDRLAEQGMRFTHCYSQPLCTPSRIKLMTGKSNVRNYSAFSILNRDEKTIGHYFQQAGYKTFVGGKWQLFGADHYSPQFRGQGTLPVDAGFDEHCLWQVNQLGSRYWQPSLTIQGRLINHGASEYGPQVVADHICDFIHRHQKESFFVYYPMILVHSPFEPTPNSVDRTSQNPQRNFEDMVSYMDRIVGQIVDQVDSLGLAKDSLILFTGDNGTHRKIRSQLGGVEIRGGKGLTTDAGTRVPLVAYWPQSIQPGQINRNLVDMSDFLPTCLEAIAESVPSELDGLSFYRQLLGEPVAPRESIFCYYNPRPEKTQPVRFARDRRFKMYGDGRLFDLERDELERNPLPESKETQPIRERLQRVIESMPQKNKALLRFPDARQQNK